MLPGVEDSSSGEVDNRGDPRPFKTKENEEVLILISPRGNSNRRPRMKCELQEGETDMNHTKVI